MQKNILIVGFILCLTFLTGCASFPIQRGGGPAKALEPAPLLKFDDVPVPRGFKLLANESFAFHTEETRVGLLKYAGSPTADAVVLFYKEQMAQLGWTLLNVVEYGRRILNFDKIDQTCIITVEPTATKTLVTISVAPKSRVAPSAPAKAGSFRPANTGAK